jgi:hypothetical protein
MTRMRGWRKCMRWLIASVALLIASMAISARPSSGQDQTEERLNVLETRVADLEAAVYQATPTAPPGATPSGGAKSQSTVGGNALSLLPPGEPGSIVVVAAGQLERSQVPLVVRNNSDAPIAGATVKVEARDAAGNLVAVGETVSSHQLKPYLLQPGEVAIGFALLTGAVPPASALSFIVDSDQVPGSLGDFNTDLVIDEASWLEDRIVGVARNPTDQVIGSVYANLVCFASDGTPTQAEPSTIQGTIAPGTTTSFQIGGGMTDASGCETFLVAATGHPQP